MKDWYRQWWVVLALLVGCTDNPRPRIDLDEEDVSIAVEAGIRDSELPDRGVFDTALHDVQPELDVGPSVPDIFSGQDAAEPDVNPDIGFEPDVFMPVPDAAEPDVGLDDARPPPDSRPPDPDMALPPTGFATGLARAADRRVAVTVRAGELVTLTDGDGRYRIGPLPPGITELRFEADRHQFETTLVEIPDEDEVEAAEVLLYRGTRISQRQPSQVRFRFDDEWVVWETEQRLEASRTAVPGGRTLVDGDHEVFLGFVNGEDAIVARRRTVPGLAGDIYYVPLAGGDSVRLFEEGQPWVRWLGDVVLGMVNTRDALSHLQVTRPGERPREIAAGVPWLLVTQIADGRIAYASGEGPDFDVFISGLSPDATPEKLNEPGMGASDLYLSTTPGRTGLIWLTPEMTLWRWALGQGAVALAENVAASPRPRFLNAETLLFWRTEPGGTLALYMYDGRDERLITDRVVPGTFTLNRRDFYVMRRDLGIHFGSIDGPLPEQILPEGVFTASNGGIVALIDGVAWRHHQNEGVLRLGGLGLSALRRIASGATAWQVDGSRLLFLPGPGAGGDVALITEGGPRAAWTLEPGGEGIYALGPDGYLRAPLPPNGEQTLFETTVTRITPIDSEALLGQNGANDLVQIDPQTGASFGWAQQVTRVTRSSRRSFVAYVCDRGLFLVPLE